MIKKGNLFVERWEPPMSYALNNGHGLVSSSGDYWVEQRRFALHTLRNLGVSRNIMEGRIMEEFHCRFDNIKPDEIIFANQVFDIFTANVINRMLFSYRFDEKNQDIFYDMKKQMDKQLQEFSFLDICLPDVAFKIPYFRKRWDTLLKPFYDTKEFLKKQIVERIEEVKSGKHEIDEEPSDFVDTFIREMEKMDNNNQQSSFSVETLVSDVLDLYIAGQETTSNTLAWAVAYLMNYPDVAVKLRGEIRSVTGGNRDLSQLDKPKTPYLNATINEVQRLGNIVPVNLFRRAAENVDIGGIMVRKGQIVTAQIGNIMNDEKYFDDPTKFNPDRYLTADKLESHTVPFGLGKRSCLGESLARAELYLILGNLVQNYKFEVADEMPKIEAENENASLRRPKYYKIRLVKIE
ncbi:hypothetical protein WR25_06814 [Diploscapter pachys]|uniref:Unspecific monooxygenase n=1 Tax=Diploscapter pachys TaxID=2018661 RepID=A0A2A2LMX9_9BILA|nr:hypothetical protein WR25_06814 [Diploscapter pachys]